MFGAVTGVIGRALLWLFPAGPRATTRRERKSYSGRSSSSGCSDFFFIGSALRALGVIRILERDEEIISEDCLGFFKADPVFGDVGGRLVGVPFEAHRGIIPSSSTPTGRSHRAVSILGPVTAEGYVAVQATSSGASSSVKTLAVDAERRGAGMSSWGRCRW